MVGLEAVPERRKFLGLLRDVRPVGKMALILVSLTLIFEFESEILHPTCNFHLVKIFSLSKLLIFRIHILLFAAEFILNAVSRGFGENALSM